jgi:hypothetical protein
MLSSAAASRNTRLIVVLCVLLAATTITLYSPVGGHSFISWDDQDYVTANPHIQAGLIWSTIKWASTATYASNWHPLTWLSHAIDFQLFALNPSGHHWMNLLIHALNAVLLFLVLAWITRRIAPSLMVAALFALHPLNVESVAWVAERKNVLSTFFFILAIAAYAWYSRKPDWRRYALVAALFAAGLMAKPMVITLPFVLLLLDYWPLDRLQSQGSSGPPPTSQNSRQSRFSLLFLEKLPLFVLSAASAWITIVAQRSGHAVRTLQQSSLSLRIENAIVSYALYAWKTFWPAHLAILYPFPEKPFPWWQVTLSALLLLAVTVLVLVFRRRRYLPVGWVWFLGTLVPVIGLVRVGSAAMADRYAYIPLIGIFLMIAWSLDDWAEARSIATIWRVVPALCVLAALGVCTSRQLSNWNNEYDLWSQALAVNERNPFAHDALALFLVGSGADSLSQRDNLNTRQKQMAEARVHFERAVELRRQMARQNPAYLPDLASNWRSLGNLDLIESRLDESRQHYQESLQIFRQLEQQNPNSSLADVSGLLGNLGYIDEQQQRLDEARQYDAEALQINRKLAHQDPYTYFQALLLTLSNLAHVDQLLHRTDESRQYYGEALRMTEPVAHKNPAFLPEVAATLESLALMENLDHQFDAADRRYEEALKIRRQVAQMDQSQLPYVALTLYNLALVNEIQNRIEDARAHGQEALGLFRMFNQANPSAYVNEIARTEASLAKLEKKARSH